MIMAWAFGLEKVLASHIQPHDVPQIPNNWTQPLETFKITNQHSNFTSVDFFWKACHWITFRGEGNLIESASISEKGKIFNWLKIERAENLSTQIFAQIHFGVNLITSCQEFQTIDKRRKSSGCPRVFKAAEGPGEFPIMPSFSAI